MQTVKRKRTLIKFAVQKTKYQAEQGAKTDWEIITANIGLDDNNNKITTDCFYCEWLNSYGYNAIVQQQDGVIESARIRMTFIKSIYDVLCSNNVRIYRNGKTDKANTFVLNSSVDNYLENNKMLEFNVKRFVDK